MAFANSFVIIPGSRDPRRILSIPSTSCTAWISVSRFSCSSGRSFHKNSDGSLSVPLPDNRMPQAVSLPYNILCFLLRILPGIRNHTIRTELIAAVLDFQVCSCMFFGTVDLQFFIFFCMIDIHTFRGFLLGWSIVFQYGNEFLFLLFPIMISIDASASAFCIRLDITSGCHHNGIRIHLFWPYEASVSIYGQQCWSQYRYWSHRCLPRFKGYDFISLLPLTSAALFLSRMRSLCIPDYAVQLFLSLSTFFLFCQIILSFSLNLCMLSPWLLPSKTVR